MDHCDNERYTSRQSAGVNDDIDFDTAWLPMSNQANQPVWQPVRQPVRLRSAVMGMLTAVLLAALSIAAPNAHAIDIDAHPPLKKIVDRLVNEDGFDRAELKRVFDTVTFKQKIIDSIRRPAERLKWFKYRPLFVTEDGAKKGVAFIEANRDAFERAETEFGVPIDVIAAIIGVETRYGRVTGKHRILDSLTTLTVGYPRRAAFFGSELREFLILAKEENMDPLTLKGSYAGAMGIGQFIASSYRNYAIDFSGDGVRDLLTTPADAIGSVANYLRKRGWKPGVGVITPVSLAAGVDGASLATKGRKPDRTVGELASLGARLQTDAPAETKAGLIRLDNSDGPVYRGALPNYFAIMTYNPSQMYAMAVSELAETIRLYR